MTGSASLAPVPLTGLEAAARFGPMRARLTLQKQAFMKEGPPDLATRRARLDTLRQAIASRRAGLLAAAAEDFGHRDTRDLEAAELVPVLRALSVISRRLPRWMGPERRWLPPEMLPASAKVTWQPRGVVGLSVAPGERMLTALVTVGLALAAGNRVMWLPSDEAPSLGAALHLLLSESFDAVVVDMLPADRSLAQGFAALPFDAMHVVGTAGEGRLALRAASAGLTPVSLSLLSRSVVIAGSDAVAEAARASAAAKLALAGRGASAPDLALVPEAQVASFCTAYIEAARTLYPDGLTDPALTAVAGEARRARLEQWVEEARAGRGVVQEVFDRRSAPALPAVPVLVADAPWGARLCQEHVGGPVMAVVGYGSIDSLLARVAAAGDWGAIAWFGADPSARRRLSTSTRSARLTFDGIPPPLAAPDLPFAEVGAAGTGPVLGREAFRSFCHGRTVIDGARRSLPGALRGPGARLARLAARWLYR